MARFIYRMQSILEIKEKMESQVKMEYATAQNQLVQEKEQLGILRKKKRECEKAGRELLNGRLVLTSIEENKALVKYVDGQIKEQIIKVNLAEKKLDAIRERLTRTMQERKTHENLREKAFEDFKKEIAVSESKEIDELTSYQYGQKEDE